MEVYGEKLNRTFTHKQITTRIMKFGKITTLSSHIYLPWPFDSTCRKTEQLPPPFIWCFKGESESWKFSCSVKSDSLQPHRQKPTRLLCPWDFPGKNTGVDCHFLLQMIFTTQGLNPGLPRYRQMLYCLSHQRSFKGEIQRIIIIYDGINQGCIRLPCLFNLYAESVSQLSRVRLFATPWTAALQVSLSITNSQSLLKLISIVSVMPFNHLILHHTLLLLPSTFSSIRIFFNESVLCIRWPKDWSFSFSISPSNEYSGLISLGWTGWIFLQSKGLSRISSNTTVQKHQSSVLSFLYSPILTSIPDYCKNHSFDYRDLCRQSEIFAF